MTTDNFGRKLIVLRTEAGSSGNVEQPIMCFRPADGIYLTAMTHTDNGDWTRVETFRTRAEADRSYDRLCVAALP